MIANKMDHDTKCIRCQHVEKSAERNGSYSLHFVQIPISNWSHISCDGLERDKSVNRNAIQRSWLVILADHPRFNFEFSSDAPEEPKSDIGSLCHVHDGKVKTTRSDWWSYFQIPESSLSFLSYPCRLHIDFIALNRARYMTLLNRFSSSYVSVSSDTKLSWTSSVKKSIFVSVNWQMEIIGTNLAIRALFVTTSISLFFKIHQGSCMSIFIFIFNYLDYQLEFESRWALGSMLDTVILTKNLSFLRVSSRVSWIPSMSGISYRSLCEKTFRRFSLSRVRPSSVSRFLCASRVWFNWIFFVSGYFFFELFIAICVLLLSHTSEKISWYICAVLQSSHDVPYFRVIIVSLYTAISVPVHVTYIDFPIVVDLTTHAIQMTRREREKDKRRYVRDSITRGRETIRYKQQSKREWWSICRWIISIWNE